MEHISRRGFLAQSLRLVGAAAVLAVPSGAAWLLCRYPPPGTLRKVADASNPLMRQARWWKTACAGVQCTLCPFECFLPEGQRGICNVRQNVGGRLMTLVYAQPVSIHIDPIEKKPVHHLLPGTTAYSLATVGCNLRCAFCQNWEISQALPEHAVGTLRTPAQIVQAALAAGSASVAYTYAEPAVFYEYVHDTAVLAKQAGLHNVMVSAGYINPEPLRELAPLMDMVKIDLKGFNERFYRRVVKGELRFVLRTLRELRRLNTLVEIVNLVVPGMNDDPREIRAMCEWISREMGPQTPLFFSRFTPNYRLQNLPPTPVETLERAHAIAKEVGLDYVYIGNVHGHPTESTFCPKCGRVMIKRHGYSVQEYNLQSGGYCPFDGTRIPGIWL